MTELRRRAARGLAWSTAAASITGGLAALRLGVAGNFLTPAEFGVMAMANVVIGFATAYADGGLGAAVIHRHDATSRQLSSLYWFNILVGVLLFALTAAAAPLAAILFSAPELTSLVTCIAVSFLIAPWGTQFELLMRRELRFKALSAIHVAGQMSGSALTILLVAAGGGVWGFAWGQLLTCAVVAALAFLAGRKFFIPDRHFSWNEVRGFMSFGLFQVGERNINFLNQRMDQVALGALFGAGLSGVYAFAFNIASLPSSRINPVVTSVALPFLSKVRGDETRVRRAFLLMARGLVAVNAPLLLAMFALADVGIPLVFGQAWGASISIFRILCLVVLLRTMVNPVGSLLLSAGHADKGFYWNLALLGVFPVSLVIGARLGGLMGTALSLLAVQAASIPPAYIFLMRPLVGRCGPQYILAVVSPVALSGIAACGAAAACWMAGGGWLGLACGGLTMAVLYASLVWTFGGDALVEFHRSIGLRSRTDAV
jgi:lipopolysaccharide exporter